MARVVEDWKTHDVSEEYTMTRIADISRRFSTMIISTYAMSVLLYAAGTVLRSISRSSNQTDARELILKMELPFEIKSTSVYITVLITQFIHQTSAASTVGVVNSFLISLVSLFYNLSMFLQRKTLISMRKILSKIIDTCTIINVVYFFPKNKLIIYV